MSGFLIDRNVLSEYNRPGGPDARVKRWLETTNRQTQHVSVITPRRFKRESSCSPTESAASNWNSGSSKTWKPGFPAESFQWIVKWRLAGRRSWRRELAQEGLCLQSIH
jgi:hypothetical protein